MITEIEAIADAHSVSVRKPFGVDRMCRLVGKPRSSFYYKPQAVPQSRQLRRGPKVRVSDEEVLSQVRRILKERPFLGEGHRKIHAALKFEGICVGRDRLLRILREHQLLAPYRQSRCLGPRNHDGTIQTERPNEMWGTDLTFTMTEDEGMAAVFVAVEHFNAECVGIHAALSANRFEAMEPVRQGVRERFRGYGKNIAQGLKLRHDHGTQYISNYFQNEIQFVGIESSPSFIRSPEGNGVAERFIRTLKEQLLWVKRFKNLVCWLERWVHSCIILPLRRPLRLAHGLPLRPSEVAADC
ncbi:MAG: IS3 family transposase [Bdellovibrionaceae bacterium]|nr:IS3 family transposase [Pseudobdellovibrionaceae bacterium]